MASSMRVRVRWGVLGALCLFSSPLPALAQDEGGGNESSSDSAGGDSSGAWGASETGGEAGDMDDEEDRTEDSDLWTSSSRGKSD
jgi:hypothetical protein